MDIMIKYNNDEVMKHAPFNKAYIHDAGFDLYNASNETITLAPDKSAMIPAGISVKLDDHSFGLVWPRSSTFKKRGIFVVNGLIDPGYTGPLFTMVWHPNLDGMDRPILIEPWERLSQLIIIEKPKVKIKIVDKLPKTVRGDRGFGSSGN
jgi:dUTP pyrophosphatase